MITSNSFKDGMRRLVSGVSLITSSHGGERFGTVATSVTAVSADPPTLLVCLNRGNSCHDAVASSSAFCVNFLGRDAQALSTRFATPADRHTRFDIGEWDELATGSPVLVQALVNFDCRVVNRIEADSHTIFLGRIEDSRMGALRAPLLYGNGCYGDFMPGTC